MSGPQYLFAAEDAIRDRVRRARRLALFTDFDGTLAPIRRHPAEVRLPARARRLLAALAQRRVLVGIISGRPLRETCALVGLRGIWYVGAHGFFLRTPSNRILTLLNPSEKSRIARAQRWLARRLAGVPGVRLEPKEATLAVHYRGASPRSIARARSVLAQLMENEHTLHLMSGEKIWEILPGEEVTKWAGVRFILQHHRVTGPAGPWLVTYLGDDVTDERVFERLKGISVAVGKKRHTAARFFVRSPEEVHQFLQKLRAWLA